MINVCLTVREAVLLAMKCDDYGGDEGRSLRDRIITALEKAVHKDTCNLTIKHIPVDNFISAIRVIRNTMVWTLRDTKEFCDVVRGKWQTVGEHYDELQQRYVEDWGFRGGKHNTLTAPPNVIRSLADELTKLGCEVVTD